MENGALLMDGPIPFDMEIVRLLNSLALVQILFNGGQSLFVQVVNKCNGNQSNQTADEEGPCRLIAHVQSDFESLIASLFYRLSTPVVYTFQRQMLALGKVRPSLSSNSGQY